MRRFSLAVIAMASACGTGTSTDGVDSTEVAVPVFELPVLTNPEVPISYPPGLYRQGVEASVTLRLFVNENGEVVEDSTRVAESSGYAAFDSAAVAGVTSMDFAPARRKGRPVATLFLQPVHFKLPTRPAPGEPS
ncbi:MAG: energy transducer TonB [Gemmatimonadales bacterium]